MTDFLLGNLQKDDVDIQPTDIYRTQNEIWFSFSVNNESINKVIKLMYEIIHDEKLSAYRENNDLEIILHIDSGGGLVSSAFKFIDFVKQLQKKNIKLRTIINGKACSAATLMAIIGDKRQITKHSYAMIHELSSSTWGSFSQLKSYQKHLDSTHNQIVDLYIHHNNLISVTKSECECMHNKNTGNADSTIMNKQQIEDIMNKETSAMILLA